MVFPACKPQQKKTGSYENRQLEKEKGRQALSSRRPLLLSASDHQVVKYAHG
jgi:hypothetical protein